MGKLIVTASVTCNDRYIPVATDADGDLPASCCGFDYDGTLSEYAAKKDKELLQMNLGINDEKVGVVSASVHFENISEHELLIMYSAEKSGRFDSIETTCAALCLAWLPAGAGYPDSSEWNPYPRFHRKKET